MSCTSYGKSILNVDLNTHNMTHGEQVLISVNVYPYITHNAFQVRFFSHFHTW